MQTADNKKTLRKTTTTLKTINAEIYKPSSILQPILIVEYDATLINANYLHIALFNRYYFINDKIIDSGGKMKITCENDPLMSFADSILNLNCTVARNEFANSLYQVDNQIVVQPKCDINVIKSNHTPFNIRTSGSEINFVLCIAGGNTGGGE